MTAILFSSLIGPVPIDVLVKEGHSSTIGITENPVESGAKITDHSYIEPKTLTLEIAASNATATYNALVRFQETRIPFVFVSGLYVYTNMLIRSLQVERDETHSRVLRGIAQLQEVIIVDTAHVAGQGTQGLGKSNATAPGETAQRAAPTTLRGDQPTVPEPARQSILGRVFGDSSAPLRESNPGGIGGV